MRQLSKAASTISAPARLAFDTFITFCYHASVSENQNQFFVTRAAPINRLRSKKQISIGVYECP
jgi:hypothetical protein